MKGEEAGHHRRPRWADEGQRAAGAGEEDKSLHAHHFPLPESAVVWTAPKMASRTAAVGGTCS